MSCDEERRPVAEFVHNSILFCSMCRRKKSSRLVGFLYLYATVIYVSHRAITSIKAMVPSRIQIVTTLWPVPYYTA